MLQTVVFVYTQIHSYYEETNDESPNTHNNINTMSFPPSNTQTTCTSIVFLLLLSDLLPFRYTLRRAHPRNVTTHALVICLQTSKGYDVAGDMLCLHDNLFFSSRFFSFHIMLLLWELWYFDVGLFWVLLLGGNVCFIPKQRFTRGK